jgi:hypothetical protein
MSKKSGSRTPSRTPRAKTPVIKNISMSDVASTVATTAAAVVDAIPGLKITEEKVAPIVYSMDYRRIFLMVLAFAVFLICLILFWYNGAEQRDLAVAEFGSKIPGFMFNGVFVVFALIFSFLGFGFIVYHIEKVSFAFLACAILYLVAFAMLFVKLYFSIALHSAAVQIFSFIIFVTSVLLVLQVPMGSRYPLLSIFAIIPSVLYSGFALYTGGVLNPRTF